MLVLIRILVVLVKAEFLILHDILKTLFILAFT